MKLDLTDITVRQPVAGWYILIFVGGLFNESQGYISSHPRNVVVMLVISHKM